MTASPLTLAEAYRLVREDTRDKSYQLLPMGMEAAAYLRAKRKRLTAGSYRKYEAALDKLARKFPDLELKDFERPIGTTRLEEFMDEHWGPNVAEPRTYNSNLSIIKDFFRHQVDRGLMDTDPARPIERSKPRDVHRTTFDNTQYESIILAQDDLRDRLCLRLLLDYGIRKGSLRGVRIKDFDWLRKRLTVHAKGGVIYPIPIADPDFWHELERLVQDTGAEPHHYLMPGRRGNRHGVKLLPETQISNHALHNWWYRCLNNAGIVAAGTTKGEKMHKARHTAGQRLLDETGNLKAVQKLLGHKSMLTTADVYLDWDIDALERSMTQMFERRDDA